MTVFTTSGDVYKRQALVRNTDMQTAHLRVKEAEASLLTSKLSYLPTLFLAPEGAVSSLDRAKATQTYSLPVTASWELDIFGKVTTAKRRAKAAYEQSKEYEQAVKTQLVAAMANAYYTLLMLDSQYEIAVATEAAWKESVRTTRATVSYIHLDVYKRQEVMTVLLLLICFKSSICSDIPLVIFLRAF